VLEALRIVEFAEGVAGPLAALRLADLGARVVKIETDEGDWMREAEPAMADGQSAAFFALNRGKRALRLGAQPQAAASLILDLLAMSDVLITDRTDADLRALGIGEALATGWQRNPGLIIADVSIWGAHGPMAGSAGSELTVQAMAGYTRYLGTQADAPRRLGADVGGVGAAAFTAQAVLASLYARTRASDGVAQRVSTSMLNALISMKSIHLAAQSDPDQYSGPRIGGPHEPPEQGWRTADRPIFFAFGGSVGAEGRPGWATFVEDVGLGHLLTDARLDHNGRNSTGHGSLVHEYREVYEAAFARYTADDLVARIRKLGANAAVYMRADETLAHPQTAALDVVRTVGPDAHKVLAFPARFSGIELAPAGEAPALGAHTAEIAGELGVNGPALAALRRAGALA
jgi:formyl-CoA transferase